MRNVVSIPSTGHTPPKIIGRGLLLGFIVTAACRPEPDWTEDGLETGWITIYDIQNEHADTEDPELGSRVSFRSVVVSVYDNYAEPTQDREQNGSEYTCVQDMGYIGAVVIQESDGGPRSGVSLFNPTLVPANQEIGPGDLVDVRGEYLEFCLAEPDFHADSYCDAPNTERLTQLGGATVTRVGEASPPIPYPLLRSELDNDQAMEDYEGVLVQINERLQVTPCTPYDSRDRPNCCVGDYDRYGNLSTNLIQITNEFYSIPDGVTCISSITGVVTWFFEYNISPRGPADVVIPEDCRPGF